MPDDNHLEVNVLIARVKCPLLKRLRAIVQSMMMVSVVHVAVRELRVAWI